uniref:RNase H type-1 domain-containing protein n=1 Tax=Cannabis sativa TaxID=3483 RepID=A0A803PMD2_CANSA
MATVEPNEPEVHEPSKEEIEIDIEVGPFVINKGYDAKALYVLTNLARHDLLSDGLCPLCGLEDETTYHALWGCSSLLQCKKIYEFALGDPLVYCVDFLDFIHRFIDSLSKEMIELVIVIKWRIWSSVIKWGLKTVTHPPLLVVTAPPLGSLKVNTDAALSSTSNCNGLDMVIRDDSGVVALQQEVSTYVRIVVVAKDYLSKVVWVHMTKLDFSDVLRGEAATVCLALEVAKDKGHKFILVENDSKVVINSFNSVDPR